MPWGGSEQQQPACKRRQVSKAHSVLCTQRLQWSHQSVFEEFLAGVLDRLCPWTDYGAVELDLNWAYPLEMLSFGQGDLTVTLSHWWRNQTQIFRGLYSSIVEYGQVCWVDTLNASGELYPEWSRRKGESAGLNAQLTGKLSDIWYPEQRSRVEPSGEQSRIKRVTHDRSKPFMGRGSLHVTSPLRSCKATLWTVLVSLLLLSVMITGSPTPEMSMVGGPSPERESDSLGMVGQGNLEPTPADSMELPIRSTWSSYYPDNITSEGQSDDDFPDDLLFRSERSPGDSKPKKNKKKPNNRGGGRGGGGGGKGCSLRRLRVKVRELGLGHNSDESITFKYCSGACQQTRSNYDITLSTLLKHKLITPGSHERISSHPCCRPTRYEAVSFLDVKNTWKIVDMLSAAECSCVG
ncbi:artemin [Rhinophrynus dorsalis]